MTQFFYGVDESVIGPVTGIQVRDAALAGQVTPQTLVATDESGPWVPASRVKNLFDADGKALPQPPSVGNTADFWPSEQSPTTPSPESMPQTVSQPLPPPDREPKPEPPPLPEPTVTPVVARQPLVQSSDAGWYYLKVGFVDDQAVGPISEQEMLRLSRMGDLRADTQVFHQHRTNGNWVQLSNIPAAREQLEAGASERRDEAAADKIKREQARAEKREFKERLRREKQLAEQAERQARATEQQRLANERAVAAQALPVAPQTLAPAPAKPTSPQFHCPFCQSTRRPRKSSKITTAGWIFFWVLLLFLCLPLCWIGLLMTEQQTHCSDCGMKLG